MKRMLQNSKLQIKAQAMQLYKMLSKPFSQRMPFEGVEIAKTLQKVLLLSKLFDMKSQPFINLCISSQIIQFQPLTSIYGQQNKKQRYIYIILEGSVNIKLKLDQADKLKSRKILDYKYDGNSIKKYNENEQNVNVLTQFGLFGHTEIFFGLSQRNQFIMSGEKKLVCMVLPEDKVLEIMSEDMKKFMAKAYHYLKVNHYFTQITSFQKKQLVFYMKMKTFKKGETIVQKDTPLRQIIYMINGNISVIKQIESSAYKIDSLQQMNSYGQYQCFKKSLCEFQLIANTNGSYYTLEYDNLLMNSDKHGIVNTIDEKAVPYPDEEELRFLYDVKNKLKVTCDKVAKKNRLFELEKNLNVKMKL